jgi:hypothetical protein
MPCLIEGLGYIKEGRGAVSFAIEGVKKFVNEAMCLCSGAVSPPEAELMRWD